MHLARDYLLYEGFPRLDRLFDMRYRMKPQALVYGCDVTVIIARLVILQVIRCVNVYKIWEKTFRADFACQAEQVVIFIFDVVINAGFKLKDANRENRRFAVAESRVDCVQNFANHQASFGACIHSIVD